MIVTEKIQQYVQRLPTSFQTEVLVFVEYLLAKAESDTLRREQRDWSGLSLALAMHGMEDEDTPTYTRSDLKVMFA